MKTRQPIKHGTSNAYKCGCRCTRCTKANRDACRSYRRKKGIKDIAETGNPCKINSKVYQSQTQAAVAAGVSQSTISWHLNKHGNLDRLGGKRGNPNNSRRKPVQIGEREWPSRSALERYLGVSSGRVHRWIKKGQMDLLLAALLRADGKRGTGETS
ncbi:hypothetical protein [Paracoccus sp. SSK6]|uniref:hypothetical protein n=1 Tax=Paracoccus sp. SSK6 TaxID=3143131 RepID=UPI00321998B2